MTKAQFLSLFFTNLNQNDIDYFVFGAYDSLPFDTGGSDIDIVVNQNHLIKVLQTLQELGHAGGITFASIYQNSSTVFLRLLTLTWGVQIDLFYKGFCYRGVPYYPLNNLPNYISYHNHIVKILDKHQGYCIGFFKDVIHNGRAKDKYIHALLDKVNSNPERSRQEYQGIFGETIASLILTCTSVETVRKEANSIQQLLQKRVLRNHFIDVMCDRALSVRRLWGRRPGYVIAVEGTDGSGKSFIINSITPILNEAFHNGIVYNHLRPHVLPDIAEVLGKRKKQTDGSTKVVTDPHAQKQSGFAGSLVRWSYYMIDYTFGYLRKVWLQIHSKSKVFIFDRYYYEYYLDQRRSRVNLPMWIVRLGEFFIPKPDLILCLGGDPEKIYARKPETSLEEVTRQTKVLKEFCSKRKNAVWIDTTVAPEESINAAMKAINEMMSKRFDINDLK